MPAPCILAIDQGTGSTKALLVDTSGAVIASGSSQLGEMRPHPGWVEQDPDEIWTSVQRAVEACLSGHDARSIVAVGLSTQRESIVLWERATGKPISPVLSWQDQRSAGVIVAMRSESVETLVRRKSGLPLDPMFSAAKAKWLLDTYDLKRQRAGAGAWVLGTVDAFLISRFGGSCVIEAGNASRTQLLGVETAAWDDDLCRLFDVPLAALPQVVASNGPFPTVRNLPPLPDGVPLLAVMGDSHAALFAHGGGPGTVKATYGTGSSLMGLLVDPRTVDPGVCLTIAWMIDAPVLAVEGNIRATGAALRWTAELLGMTTDALVDLAETSDSQGVVLVPGFNGLGAPWWDRDATGLITNLTLSAGRAAVARAAFEAIAHQVADVVDAINRSGSKVKVLHADGGATRSSALMQLQADICGCEVFRSNTAELSALGVAHLAGLGAGIWTSADLAALPRPGDHFAPNSNAAMRKTCRKHWLRAVGRAREVVSSAGSPSGLPA